MGRRGREPERRLSNVERLLLALSTVGLVAGLAGVWITGSIATEGDLDRPTGRGAWLYRYMAAVTDSDVDLALRLLAIASGLAAIAGPIGIVALGNLVDARRRASHVRPTK
ncbi:hypothetical protein [Agrococcus jejuensis]|uniref:Uncharacterized protein n=1 Tax=Agrococcus jejuensis TaxID=399736 RepID=A0A1G8EC62_9MICO|nr:hypothetical protein [Agrococcus jejuensis]SDH67447.1 hypothetical protein SAMN04489720_1975 [Agrococcus jejuensis]